MTVNDVYEKYPDNKWVLLRVIKENQETHEIEEVEPLFVSDSRDEMYEKINNLPEGDHVMTLFTGPILKEGEAFAFSFV
ncbi:hypothetical protein HGA91_01705 [candidate division WWE3 bacterium]|nr:hypothetical protein [candidate division WWE3 bacterium]